VARERRDEARRWLWVHSGRHRLRACGHTVLGGFVSLVRSAVGGVRWAGLETCGSVWTCPVCSAKVLAGRADELRRALEAWTAQGGEVAMVTLTMRHRRSDSLASCWDALSDAWAAASGRSRGVRTAKLAAGVEGWARRVEVTWGARHGWHVHAHALVFLRDGDQAQQLGEAMYRAWELRLRRAGLTPIRDSGGLDVRLLALGEAVGEVGNYIAKGVYGESSQAAALELAGSGKLGRAGNLTPWGILDAARQGDRQAAALWSEWESASLGRRALTWSNGLRDRLGLGEEVEDDELAGDDDELLPEVVAIWSREDWPALRDAPVGYRRALLQVAAADCDPDEVFDLLYRAAQMFRLPLPRPGP
jgi:hypothetical protein